VDNGKICRGLGELEKSDILRARQFGGNKQNGRPAAEGVKEDGEHGLLTPGDPGKEKQWGKDEWVVMWHLTTADLKRNLKNKTRENKGGPCFSLFGGELSKKKKKNNERQNKP